MTGWAPDWQQDAAELLSGAVSVREVEERQDARRRPGSTHAVRNQAAEPAPYEPENPMLFGREEMAEASTCTGLVRSPEVIWDVNGYYRVLGIPFPHREPASRRGLMQAHLAAGGLDDRWKTYCLSQLLDVATRAEYDRMPLGQVYLDDYWNEYLDNEAKKEAFRRVAAGEISIEDVEGGGEADRIKREEWGLRTQAEAEAAKDVARSASRNVTLTWSYYLWRCSYAAVSDRAARLDTWRTLLVEAFRDLGVHLRFRVGFVGRQSHPWLRIEWDGHLIFFLNRDQEPTTEYAVQAAHHTQRELGLHTDNVMIEENNHGSQQGFESR